MKKIALHIYSAISSSWIIFNLGFWMIPILMIAAGKLLLPGIGSFWLKLIAFCYHSAVRLNSLWMLYVVGVRINIHGDIGIHPSPIVISNHQSWFDIPIIHHVITDTGPIIKFLIKRQLVWVPIIGWLCWILGFPRLYRGQGHRAREKDYETIRKFSERATTHPGAVLIYPEGTRFTETKREKQNSPYKHLLKPRMGGLRILKEAANPDTPIIDVTIKYVGGNNNFWEGMHGATKDVDVIVKVYRLRDIHDLRKWLNERWREKEKIISAT